MSRKVIITGATGFIGSNLVEFLLNKNFNVYIISRKNSDFTNLNHLLSRINVFYYDNELDNLITFFKETQPELVFHLASNFIAEHKPNQIDSLVTSNITFGLHILEAMKESNVKKMINTGTSWQHFNNEDYNPVCLYAATKQAFESLIEYYIKAEGFKVITLKLFDTYGENDRRPKLINLLNKFADEKTELKMSPGEQILNLVHISDVCNAFYVASNLILRQEEPNHTKYAVPSNNSYQLKEVINVFEMVTNKIITVTWGGKPYRNREVMVLWDNYKTLPHWKPEVSLAEGLKKYL